MLRILNPIIGHTLWQRITFGVGATAAAGFGGVGAIVANESWSDPALGPPSYGGRYDPAGAPPPPLSPLRTALEYLGAWTLGYWVVRTLFG